MLNLVLFKPRKFERLSRWVVLEEVLSFCNSSQMIFKKLSALNLHYEAERMSSNSNVALNGTVSEWMRDETTILISTGSF